MQYQIALKGILCDAKKCAKMKDVHWTQFKFYAEKSQNIPSSHSIINTTYGFRQYPLNGISIFYVEHFHIGYYSLFGFHLRLGFVSTNISWKRTKKSTKKIVVIEKIYRFISKVVSNFQLSFCANGVHTDYERPTHCSTDCPCAW